MTQGNLLFFSTHRTYIGKRRLPQLGRLFRCIKSVQNEGGEVSEAQNYILAEKDYMAGMKYKDIAAKHGVSLNTVKSWKVRYGWDKKGVHTKSEKVCTQNQKKCAHKKKKHGGQPGNKNAVGHGAPKGNQNAVKHGLFSRYLPEETRELFYSLDSADPLELLWDQIKLAYTAILRAQQIMHVKDQADKTIEKIEDKRGKIIGERWEVQQAWDKQASFLQAQARAQRELTSMIRQYEELLHKNWKLATKEQKARIEQLKAQTQKITGEGLEIEDMSEIEAEIYETDQEKENA